MSHSVYMFNLQGTIVAESGTDPRDIELGIQQAIESTPIARHVRPQLVDVTPIAEKAFCCPVCAADIEVSYVMNGKVSGRIDPADGSFVDDRFDGEKTPVYQCIDDPSHDISEVVAQLRALGYLSV